MKKSLFRGKSSMNRRNFLGLFLRGALLGAALSTSLGRAALHLVKVERRVVLEVAPGIDNPLAVGVNGDVMLLPCGEPINIPYPYYEVLKNAIKRTYVPSGRGNVILAQDEPYYPHKVYKIYDREQRAII